MEEAEKAAKEKAEEEKEEMKEKIDKMTSFIPFSFYVRVVLGVGIVFILSAVYYAFSTFAVDDVISSNDAVFMSDYRAVLMAQMASIAISVATPSILSYEKSGFNVSSSTNPVWSDLSHMSHDVQKMQMILSKLVTFFIGVNRKVNEGGNAFADGTKLTGDEALDAFSTTRTVKEGSPFVSLLYGTQTCLCDNPEECSIKDRLYGMEGTYAGLEGLIETALSHIIVLSNITILPNSAANDANSDISDANSQENYHTTAMRVTLNASEIQFINTGVNFDIYGGLDKFNTQIVEMQSAALVRYRTILIVLFIIGIVGLSIGAFVCLFPTKPLLADVAIHTLKIEELDPNNDSSNDGVIEWSEQHTADLPRFDNAHQNVLVLARELAQAAEEVSDLHLEGSEARLKIASALSPLLIGFMSVLNDEEGLMARLRVIGRHVKMHQTEHVAVLKGLLEAIHQMALGKGSVTAVLEQINMWVTEHVAQMDKELATLISGKMESEEIDGEVDLKAGHIPRSYLEYLDSDNASMQEKTDLHKLHSLLHIKQHWEGL